MRRSSRMRDMARRRMRRDERRDMARNRDYRDGEHYSRHSDMEYSRPDYARRSRIGERSRQYDRHYDYPEYDYNYDMRSRRDYGEREYLEDDELMEWSKDLLDDVEDKDKWYFTKENIEKKAKDMGIDYRDYEFADLYTTALMKYTDHCKTLGTNNLDLYVKLAKDFLEDKDTELVGAEKLAVYYDCIVMGE